ncbi:hypothetical protein BGZ97_004041 [Linnemannia gamsii]|uniref:Peroxisomal membrane protein PEX14 n=1 Tax=Linnemannia gamsii TaxID=64522 RepID=A0A9P6QS97_9FUNG|nr:hypothetical protein BGZ97_004041 [Linnemannia gamsii]
MSDNNNNAAPPTEAGAGAPGAPSTVDPVHQLLQSNNGGQPMSAEQRNNRREALLKRQRESREKAQQMSAAARANAAPSSSAPAAATTTTPTAASSTISSTTTTAATPAPVVSAPVVAPVADTPVRENMVQQAVSFLSSPSVQSAEESKKTAFLEKKGLTLKEIEVARARVAGTATAPAVSAAALVASQPQQQPQQQTPYQTAAGTPPPVPPRTYAPAQGYAVQQQLMYTPQPQQQVAVDPNAFKKKVVLALLISGGVTVLTSVIVQKLIYPMVRGITGARQSLAVSQTEILSKLKEKLLGYKEYLVGLHLGSNRAAVKKIEDSTKDTTDKDEKSTTNKRTTIEDVDEDGTTKAVIKTTTTTTTTTSKSSTGSATSYMSTVKQLDAFSQKLESYSDQLNFEQLKATRAMAQDLAEFITKETYALSTSIAYPTSRYYGYNTGAAAASGKAGGMNDPTTPESALKSEIRSLKGLLLNWRNFPVAKEGSVGSAPSSPALPNLVQQQ